jgi:hypothetical protein
MLSGLAVNLTSTVARISAPGENQRSIRGSNPGQRSCVLAVSMTHANLIAAAIENPRNTGRLPKSRVTSLRFCGGVAAVKKSPPKRARDATLFGVTLFCYEFVLSAIVFLDSPGTEGKDRWQRSH